MLNIVADQDIPYVRELFEPYGTVTLIPGADIQASDLRNADVLLTRTVTTVNATLLKGTAVQFVGSATAGEDHIDSTALEEMGIFWCTAPGANARAASEYVLCCVAYLKEKGLLPCQGSCAAVIGVGRVGSLVADLLTAIGFKILLYDPPRAEREATFHSVSLDQTQQADLICIHTPLTRQGRFPSYHLINSDYLKNIVPHTVLLNAARGAVVDNQALLLASQTKNISICLDVWEGEPSINKELLKIATIATPHVAGYSALSKWRSLYAVYQAFLGHFRLNEKGLSKKFALLKPKQTLDISNCSSWESVLLKVYNPERESQYMREQILKSSDDSSSTFSKLRNEYLLRPEFSEIELTPFPTGPLGAVLRALGFDGGE